MEALRNPARNRLDVQPLKRKVSKEKVWHYRMLPFRILYRRVGFFRKHPLFHHPLPHDSFLLTPYHPSRIFSPQALYQKIPLQPPFSKGNEHRQSAFRLSPYVFGRWLPDKQCLGESPSRECTFSDSTMVRCGFHRNKMDDVISMTKTLGIVRPSWCRPIDTSRNIGTFISTHTTASISWIHSK
jgi:hypothetical protein